MRKVRFILSLIALTRDVHFIALYVILYVKRLDVRWRARNRST